MKQKERMTLGKNAKRVINAEVSKNGPTCDISDSDSDQEIETLLEKDLEYRRRLLEVENIDLKGLNQIPDGASANAKKIVFRIKKMHADPLFDESAANARWQMSRNQIFINRAERSKLGISGDETKNKNVSQMDNIDDIAKQAEAMALEVLDDTDGIGNMFEETIENGISTTSDTTYSKDMSNCRTRNFSKITGVNPRRILEEACRARDQSCQIKTVMISETTYSCRHAVYVRWSKDQPIIESSIIPTITAQRSRRGVLIEMTGEAASGAEQSEGYACTAALFLIFSGSLKEEKASLRLPQSYRDLYREFEALKQEHSDAQNRAMIKSIKDMLDVRQTGTLKNGHLDVEHNSVQKADSEIINYNNNFKDQIANSDVVVDEGLQELWNRVANSPSYQKMLKSRKLLPMYQFRQQALEVIQQNQCIILCGETGCGKSTQMPSFILEDQLSKGKPCKIYCTQPRRISAISLAQRVSEELGEDKGAVGTFRSIVGYAIRLESHTTLSTKLIYATVGIVLRMLESRDGLDDITHLLIDEVHERSIDTDFLLIVLKTLLIKRPDLKVVLMSATVDAERFSHYLGGAPIITVPGRTFPVRALYLEDAIEMTGHVIENGSQFKGRTDEYDEEEIDLDQVKGSIDVSQLSAYSKSTIKTLSNVDEYSIDYDLIIKTLEKLALDPDLQIFRKAVLIFLPGLAEIRQLTDIISSHSLFMKDWQIHPLHSAFSSDEQQAAFHIPPPGMRKIVLATNIAETGITIPDVTCVIDTGKHKEMRFDEKRQLSRLIQSFISRANAKQRRGRAGRVQEGICFHLFTKHRHDNLMAEQQTPEMLRLSLQDLIIRVKICRLGDIESALSQALDPPSIKNIRRAIDALSEVGALTSNEELTSLGRQIAKLPVDAHLGKLILLGNTFSCLDTCLTIAASLSSKSPFTSPMNARKQADVVRLAYKKGDSDILTVYNAYSTWRRICQTPGQSEYDFCRKNFLSPQNLAAIEDLKAQLLSSLVDTGLIKLPPTDIQSLNLVRANRSFHRRRFITLPLHCTRNESNDTILHSITAWSFYPKLLVREGKGFRSVTNKLSLSIHPTSVNKLSPSTNFNNNVNYLSFYSILQSSSKFTNARETSPVEPLMILLGAGENSNVKWDFWAGTIGVDRGRMRFKIGSWREMLLIKRLREGVKREIERGWKAAKVGQDGDEENKQIWINELIGMMKRWEEVKQKLLLST